MTETTRPILLLIDVEPDDRKTMAGKSGWESSEDAGDRLEALRARLAAATGRPVHYNWFFRCDPQIERTFGRADYVAGACPHIIRRAAANGDESGIHVHLWRWDETAGHWFNDLTDPAWLDQCLSTSIGAFDRIFGERPRMARFGDRWLSQAAVDAMKSAGIVYDFTVEPGFPGEHIHDDPHATDSLPDFRNAPREPYVPLPGNYLEAQNGASGSGDFWIVPLTTTKPKLRLVRRKPWLMRASRSPNLALATSFVWPHIKRLLDSPSRSPVVIVFRGGDLANRKFAANFARTTELLSRHPALAWCEFTTASEAVGRWSSAGR